MPTDKNNWNKTPAVPFKNRQNSYSPTVLGPVGLDHECEAHAGDLLAKRTNKFEKTVAEFAEFKENF